MRWKHWRVLYRTEAAAYARHLIEQHERRHVVPSNLDEAPGRTRRAKLTWLLHERQDEIYAAKSRSVLHRLRRIREIEIERALRWWNRRSPLPIGGQPL